MVAHAEKERKASSPFQLHPTVIMVKSICATPARDRLVPGLRLRAPGSGLRARASSLPPSTLEATPPQSPVFALGEGRLGGGGGRTDSLEKSLPEGVYQFAPSFH